ncbi:hypothetical protein, partial [Streptococcus danieliae]|uniref:hypothetical protein n=1 Tax=Streptococcus danieliae TaxID=747656 RepID=UPI0021C8BD38
KPFVCVWQSIKSHISFSNRFSLIIPNSKARTGLFRGSIPRLAVAREGELKFIEREEREH